MESLEPRHLLTGNSSSIAAVQPYNGEQLSQSPQDLVVTFNGLNVPVFMGNFDVQLEKLNSDGTMTPIWTVDDAPPEQSDATGTELIIPLQKFDTSTFGYDNLTLSAGEYEVDLVGGTGISYAASGALGAGPQLWDPNQPHPIGVFTVLGEGATISAATPLGAIGSPVQTFWGSLNPDDPQSAVDLYQFTLAEGHFWQVGLAISAHSIGSPLMPGLSLMDSSGNVLASRNSGTGLPSNPNDPYLFMGLKAGTYYVGVSGAGNLAGGSGGYDPVLGIPGSGGLPQPGGPFPFALSLVANPHDQPTRLVNFTLDRADHNGSSPTGFTLTFSGPIDLSNLFVPDTQETALEVIDSSGQVWPVTTDSYEVSGARLKLIFDRPLPAGDYTLVSASEGGLVDLAGQPVISSGNTAGVLGSWTVGPQTAPRADDNLGVLWPFSANGISPTQAGSFQQTTELAPGQGVDYRWTVIVPGFYKLQTQIGSGQVAVLNSGNGLTTVLDPGSSHQLNNYLMQLNDGVYTLRFVNVGSQPVAINWLLKIASLDWEKIVDNGVGQSFALSLSLFSAAPADSGTNSVPSFLAVPSSGAVSVFAGSAGPIPTSLLVTANTGLIGQPTLGGQTVAAVGPTVETGSLALANSGNRLDPGIRYVSALDWSRWLGNEDQLADSEPAAAQPVPNDPAVVAASVRALAGLDPEAERAGADERALGQAEWLVRLGVRLQRWLVPGTAVDGAEQNMAVHLAAGGPVRNDPTLKRGDPDGLHRTRRATSVAQVDLGAVAGVILIGATACRLQRPLLKWWRRNSQPIVRGETLARSLHRGPHSPTARATTRLHEPKAIR